MAGNVVARAWVQILPEMDGIQSEISDELKGVDKQTSSAGKSSGSGFASSFKSAVGAIGGIVAAAGIKELVQGAAEAQSQMSRLSASAQQNGVSTQSMNAAYLTVPSTAVTGLGLLFVIVLPIACIVVGVAVFILRRRR